MLTEERLHKILRLVAERGSVSTQELMDTLDISESTVRRDLTTLDEQGMISKVRGGAMVKEDKYSTVEATMMQKKDLNLEEKRVIARYAASLLQENDFVFLDAGSTTEAIVGDETVAGLQKYNFTKGFWGTNGVNRKVGFTTPDVKEAMVKKTAMEHCAKRYVLCDTSKFSQISSVKFADFANAFIITTELEDDNYAHCENIIQV